MVARVLSTSDSVSADFRTTQGRHVGRSRISAVTRAALTGIGGFATTWKVVACRLWGARHGGVKTACDSPLLEATVTIVERNT